MAHKLACVKTLDTSNLASVVFCQEVKEKPVNFKGRNRDVKEMLKGLELPIWESGVPARIDFFSRLRAGMLSCRNSFLFHLVQQVFLFICEFLLFLSSSYYYTTAGTFVGMAFVLAGVVLCLTDKMWRRPDQQVFIKPRPNVNWIFQMNDKVYLICLNHQSFYCIISNEGRQAANIVYKLNIRRWFSCCGYGKSWSIIRFVVFLVVPRHPESVDAHSHNSCKEGRQSKEESKWSKMVKNKIIISTGAWP